MAIHTGGTTIRLGSASSGLTTISATTVSSTDRAAISMAGTAYRALVPSASTSRDARDSRSPLPASSTTDSGRASTFPTNSSRSRASRPSPSRAPASAPYRISADWAMRASAISPASWSIRAAVVPCWTADTMPPSSRAGIRPAIVAAVYRPSTAASSRRWPRISRAACRRTCAVPATGRIFGPPARPPVVAVTSVTSPPRG